MPVVAGAGVLAVVIIAGLSGRGGATSADTVAPASSGAAATSSVITTLPIVVDSDPEAETRETDLKAQVFLRALASEVL